MVQTPPLVGWVSIVVNGKRLVATMLPLAGFINPQAFCELKHLKSLFLDQNSIKGSIHPCLCNMHSLVKLDLSVNHFQGTIPQCFRNMNSLQTLDLSYNQLQGNIPRIFRNLSEIERLDMSNNQFEGMLPLSIFANLSKLYYLDLSNNYKLEVETESLNWVPSFQLTELYLANCNVNKHSGSHLPSFISIHYNQKHLDLSHNSLVGSIPYWLLNNTIEILHLENNKLSGPFPQPEQSMTSKLYGLDISNNQIHGTIPTNIGLLFPNLMIFNMSINALQGSIPWSFGQVTPLVILDLSNNNLNGKIPSTLTRSESSLQYLSLSNNNLYGDILPVQFNMTSLECLQLDNNSFTGKMPPSLSNSLKLKFLDMRKNKLSGIIPGWFSNFSNLGALLLAGNHFEGNIPSQLCQMQNLRFLDLSNNSLSGSIPSCFNNISFWTNVSFWKFEIYQRNSMSLTLYYETYNFYTRGDQYPDKDNNRVTVEFTTKGSEYSFKGDPLYLMIGVDMSSNQLSATIPSEMGELRVLRSLNLSNNVLTGFFLSFQNLQSLESLDLSHNKLIGTILDELNQLHFLSTFSIAYNKFSGKIPSGQQFSTFSEDNFEGNPGLCGQPLKKNCSSIFLSEPHNNNEREEGEESGIADNPLFFYSCIAISYVLGFWGFIAPLLFSQNWRQKYFSTMEGYLALCFQKFFKAKSYLKNCGSN